MWLFLMKLKRAWDKEQTVNFMKRKKNQDTKEMLKIPMGGRGVIPDKRNYSKEVSELPFTENIKELMKVEME